MPEVHGCGDDARKKARSDWMKEHSTGGTVAGPSTKPLKAEQREQLQGKLQKKIAESGHKTKKPPKSKGQGSGGASGRGGAAGRGRGRGAGRGS
jgi:hypothetical protein